jgi:RNA polymerase sigma factor (sigma-70 family)
MDDDDDLVLLQRWCAGDRGAGERLCARYFDEIYGFFGHKVPGEADDLTQQTFLSCVKSRHQFAGRSTFRTYLFTIARNVLIDWLRRLPRHEHVDLETSSLNELVTSPSSQLREHEQRAQVRAALRQLPVEQQILLELHYWHGLDAAALAEIYETTPGTIRVRLLRAREAFRKRCGDGLWRMLHEDDDED